MRFIRTYGEFWFKIEDLLLRMKRDFSFYQIVDIAELYSSMGCGSQLFWGELEEYLLIHSSKLKNHGGEEVGNHIREDLIKRLIVTFDKVGRKNETFWKVFSTLYEENHHKYSFNDHLLIMSSFANFYPLTTMHLYTLFEKYNLSAPQIQENQQLKLQHYSTDE